MLDVFSNGVPVWAGDDTYNCFVSSFQVAGHQLLDRKSALFGGLIGPISTNVSSDVDIADMSTCYLDSLTNGPGLDDTTTLVEIHTNADIVEATRQPGCEGAIILDVPMEDIANYPVHLDLQHSGIRHCVFGQINPVRDGLLILEPTVLHEGKPLEIPVNSFEPAFLHTPSTIMKYDVATYISAFYETPTRDIFERKLAHCAKAARAGQDTVQMGSTYMKTQTKTDILSHIHHGGNASVYKLHRLALSDMSFWKSFTTDKLFALNDAARTQSAKVKSLMLRRVSLIQLGMDTGKADEKLIEAGTHLDELLLGFFDQAERIVAHG
ncbi:MAG: hypothetical protein ACSHXB_05345 [Sulfitobacter sp.]